MKVKQVDFDEDEDPCALTVHLSAHEAAYIIKVIEKITGLQADAIMVNGCEHQHEIYSCLTGAFFNRFWDGGISDAFIELNRKK